MREFYNVNVFDPSTIPSKFNGEVVIYEDGIDGRADTGKGKAFCDLGYEVVFIHQDQQLHHKDTFFKPFYEMILKVKPKYIFLANAKWFKTEEIIKLQKIETAKLIIWYRDQRGIPNDTQIRNAKYADVYSMSNTGNIPYYEKHSGTTPHFMACEALVEFYRPIKNRLTNKKDLVFVGEAYSENRICIDPDVKKVTFDRIAFVRYLKSLYRDRFDVYGKNWNYVVGRKKAGGQVKLHSVPNIYNQYKIIMGHNSFAHIDDYVSNRFWNALATGHLHITNYTKGIEHFVKDKKHCIFYNESKELPSLINYYLKYQNKAIEIGNNGRKLMLEKHTAYHRIKDLLEHVDKTPKRIINEN